MISIVTQSFSVLLIINFCVFKSCTWKRLRIDSSLSTAGFTIKRFFQQRAKLKGSDTAQRHSFASVCCWTNMFVPPLSLPWDKACSSRVSACQPSADLLENNLWRYCDWCSSLSFSLCVSCCAWFCLHVRFLWPVQTKHSPLWRSCWKTNPS